MSMMTRSLLELQSCKSMSLCLCSDESLEGNIYYTINGHEAQSEEWDLEGEQSWRGKIEAM